MNDFLIPNIAQLKLAEINALGSSVEQLQNDVDTRQSTVDSLVERNAMFTERLARADAMRDTALAHLNLAQAGITANQALLAATEAVDRQAGDTDAALARLAEKKVELIRQLTFVASLIDKAGHLANKQKAANPLIPDTLVGLLNQAGSDCANVLALGLAAQDACLVASSSMAGTHGSLDLAVKQVTALKDMLEPGGGNGKPAATEPGSVVEQMRGIYQGALQQYDAALGISANATDQINHANATLATTRARLASAQLCLAAMDDRKKGS